MKLFYKTYGEQGKVIFIVHGLFGMLDNWHNIARNLSSQYKVVTVDARNHGQSPHAPFMTFKEMADDIIELADDLKIVEFTLIGHSMGGKIAMVSASLYPKRISRLVVVDIAPKAYPPGHGKYFDAFENIDWGKMNTRQEIDLALQAYEDNLGVRLFLAKNIERKEAGGFEVKSNIEAIQNAYPEISGALNLQESYSKPTLFITGENSNYVLESDKNEILKSFPDAQFKQIPQAGHWVHAENAAGFLEALERFLN